MSVELLGCCQVPPRSFSFSFCRTLMSSDISEPLLDRKFLHFGGTFMSRAGFIVTTQFALVRFLVTLMSMLGALSGKLHVFLRDRLPSGNCLPPTQELLSALRGFVPW